jgi:hypothetical protein
MLGAVLAVAVRVLALLRVLVAEEVMAGVVRQLLRVVLVLQILVQVEAEQEPAKFPAEQAAAAL